MFEYLPYFAEFLAAVIALTGGYRIVGSLYYRIEQVLQYAFFMCVCVCAREGRRRRARPMLGCLTPRRHCATHACLQIVLLRLLHAVCAVPLRPQVLVLLLLPRGRRDRPHAAPRGRKAAESGAAQVEATRGDHASESGNGAAPSRVCAA